jgi:hypothetical protein
MVVNLDYYKKGKIIYKTATIAGFFGNETGIRVNGFSISIDERDKGSLFENIWYTILGHKGNTFALRYALENFSNYNDAFNYLKTVKTVSPCYYIIAGTEGNEGAVITRK